MSDPEPMNSRGFSEADVAGYWNANAERWAQ
jgi:hypothetical protein